MLVKAPLHCYSEDPSIALFTWFSILVCICPSRDCSQGSRLVPLGAEFSLFCLNKKLYFDSTSVDRNCCRASLGSPDLNLYFLSDTCTLTVGATTHNRNEAVMDFSKASFVLSPSFVICRSNASTRWLKFLTSSCRSALSDFDRRSSPSVVIRVRCMRSFSLTVAASASSSTSVLLRVVPSSSCTTRSSCTLMPNLFSAKVFESSSPRTPPSALSSRSLSRTNSPSRDTRVPFKPFDVACSARRVALSRSISLRWSTEVVWFLEAFSCKVASPSFISVLSSCAL
mmetsp:Transcript_1729/g.3781  ORF Transcript_1729/g.3781 Transcript_1729/m.3781 type:complete len:284 (+) Transcript_1729:141-992(+)